MKPGPELDALVAEKVMGIEVVFGKPSGTVICSGVWNNIELCDDGYMMCKHPTYNGYMEVNFGRNQYSTDISAAWEVVQKLKDEDMYYLELADHEQSGHGWYFHIKPQKTDTERCTWHIGSAHTAPHAICLAALKAIGHNTD